uniref:Zinc knuckle family protein n=1 Tax=Asparagus officinalis TaxID=4686 RepID=Q2AA56_ASPOF|nr:Zinc knuckle family protein [Asparagus officinalis]
MCHGDFMRKNADEAWEFLESLSEKIMQWEHCDDRVSSVPHFKSSGLYLESNIASEAKMATILRRLKALEIKKRAPAQINHVFAPGCYNCQSPTHISEECPLLGNNHVLEQMNDAF